MKLKKNDNVKVLAGKDSGKTGKIIQVFPLKGKVVVEGVNMLVKNLKPRQKGEKGQKIEFAAPLNVSNVILICPKCQKPVRVAYTIVKPKQKTSKADATALVAQKQKKFRVCKKCGESF